MKILMGQMGEPFLTFPFTYVQASMARQKVTEFVWSKKPRARQAVPKRVFNRIREHLEPRQSHLEFLELMPGTGRFSQEAVHTFSGVTT